MLTSVIILTYNKLDYTKACIESIRKHTESDTYEIIIIDNNSTDGTKEWLKSQSDIRVIFNSENVGFPKGCNQGIAVAIGDNILLLNNDVIVTHKWLENMLNCLYSDESVGAVGTVTNSAAYYTAIPVSYTNINEMHNFARQYNISDQTKWEERLKLIGYCMLIKKEVIDQIGLLDEIFTPGNFEDDDYSLRIRKQGFKLILCKDTFIHHYGSVSWRENIDGYTELLSSNEKKFMDKWGTNSSSYIIHNDLVDLIDMDKDSKLQILHIGCAAGGTLLKIKNKFKNSVLYGVEDNIHEFIEASKVSEKVYSSIIEALMDLENKKFDVLLITDWNYFSNLEIGINKLKKFLKPDGLLLASVLNATHYSFINSMILGRNPFLRNRHLSINDINKLFRGFKTSVKNVITSVLDEDEKQLDLYCSLSSSDMRSQYKTIKYIIFAQKYDEQLEKSILNIKNGIDIEDNLSILNSYSEEEVTNFIITHENEYSIQLLHKIAIMNFGQNYHDYVLPYLHKAYEIDPKNLDTIYNLGLILYSYNEKGLAKKYLKLLPNEQRDNEVKDILREIKKEEMKRNTELVYILRRIEHDINPEETKRKIVRFISNDYYQENEILETIQNQTINKEKVLNAIAIYAFESNLHDAIFPYLNRAYEINSKNNDTLFNLGFILAEYGHVETAISYIEKMDVIDQDAFDLLERIKGDRYG
jgi:O-antigen biosynthesis protein